MSATRTQTPKGQGSELPVIQPHCGPNRSSYSSLASADNAFDCSTSRLLACTDTATSTTNTRGKTRKRGSRISRTSKLLDPLGTFNHADQRQDFVLEVAVLSRTEILMSEFKLSFCRTRDMALNRDRTCARADGPVQEPTARYPFAFRALNLSAIEFTRRILLRNVLDRLVENAGRKRDGGFALITHAPSSEPFRHQPEISDICAIASVDGNSVRRSGPSATSTILPITPPVTSISCAFRASANENRWATSG